ncbi:hypothetical protein BKA82DRAFT_335929 [Pisolithus tinctorius]|uniref:Uncharacterized protein n=1 Tax=Pisolithus tinctorius Marx 270 TaxID=870435 RepID=A0A0C3NHK1_PISTI|nr:hypothetical protein BKA82DRAFT_335929 [Pisolithus tinctorius]KIN94918.1 hypothetical protein M404DRAFT_335929 [Pisolithus tinctorius Marx 270]
MGMFSEDVSRQPHIILFTFTVENISVLAKRGPLSRLRHSVLAIVSLSKLWATRSGPQARSPFLAHLRGLSSPLSLLCACLSVQTSYISCLPNALGRCDKGGSRLPCDLRQRALANVDNAGARQ